MLNYSNFFSEGQNDSVEASLEYLTSNKLNSLSQQISNSKNSEILKVFQNDEN